MNPCIWSFPDNGAAGGAEGGKGLRQGIELNPEYVAMAEAHSLAPLKAQGLLL